MKTVGISAREQRLLPGIWARHRHNTAYGALILDGGYSETGDHGRFVASAGDVVVHGPFEAHANTIVASRSVVLNFPLPARHKLPPIFQPEDADALRQAVRSGETDLEKLLVPKQVKEPVMQGWEDVLADELRIRPVSISRWAEQRALNPSVLSRAFRRSFGVTAARYRLEQQTHRALRRLHRGRLSLAGLALDCGFADQAHMSRAIAAMTGRSPSNWLKDVKTVQD